MSDTIVDEVQFEYLTSEFSYVKDFNKKEVQSEDGPTKLYELELADNHPSEEQAVSELRSVLNKSRNKEGETTAFCSDGVVYLYVEPISTQNSNFTPEKYKVA